MGSAELWRWIWLLAAVIFAVGGAGTKRSAILAPLAVAAGAAFMVMMFQQSPATALIVFLVVTALGAVALVALASQAGEQTVDSERPSNREFDPNDGADQ